MRQEWTGGALARRGLVLGAILVGYLVVLIDVSILMLGRRRMFTAGIALFVIASLPVGTAQSPLWMITARAVQGVGAALLAPSTLALLATSFPEGDQRMRAMAAYGALAGIGTSVGLILGSALTALWSWRVGFFLNVFVDWRFRRGQLARLGTPDGPPIRAKGGPRQPQRSGRRGREGGLPKAAGRERVRVVRAANQRRIGQAALLRLVDCESAAQVPSGCSEVRVVAVSAHEKFAAGVQPAVGSTLRPGRRAERCLWMRWVMLMRAVSRRRFLELAGGGVAATMLSDSIARALAIPANRSTRSLRDVEHIVVLTQENRSFDHYFGVMRGVRGFGDPHPVTLPSGKPVWFQAEGTTVVPPFHPSDPNGQDNLALTFIEDLDHNWDPTHQMFNGGNWDQWLPTKTTTCMAHMERSDLPFHYTLADAFTVCDGYHCSVFGPTDPNRYYIWTGWDGNDGKGGGPVIANDEIGYSWTTYPERLQAAGISWKIYQDIGNGLDRAGVWGFTSDPYIGNFGDNSLLYFLQYQNAKPGNPLYDRARTGTDVKHGGGLFDSLAADVANDRLPSVSWIPAPEAYTEHPPWPPGYGAFYTAGILDALTSNPEVWSKTALFINWDENDGFFDHIVGPYPSVGTLAGESTVPLDNELFNGTAGTTGGTNGVPGPYGLGVRVPLLVVSPWSKGGWVCSEVFDATSLIRFIEARFGVEEPNLTPWRRAVCGDLTSAFDFARGSDQFPPLPSVGAYKPDQSKPPPPKFHPVPPASGSVPSQESGVRPSRRLGYRFDVDFHADPQTLDLTISNRGRLGIGLQTRSLTVAGAPYSYTIGAGDKLAAALPNPGTYDLSLHGPNGFFRHFAGSPGTVVRVEVHTDDRGGTLRIRVSSGRGSGDWDRHRRAITIAIADAYGRDRRVTVQGTKVITIGTRHSGGWYDVALTTSSDPSFSYQLAGRIESGARLTSDPQLGRR